MADTTSGASSIQETLSSWDNCMSQAYCKWPVIVGIILGSILALSILWCLVKCICGGIVDCCCGCCDCCRSRNKGYQQPAPPPQYPMHNQYYGPQQPTYSSAPMYAPSPMYAPPPQMSGGAGYRSEPNKTAAFNEDALPSFPIHNSNRNDDLEMGHVQNPHAAQQQALLSQQQGSKAEYYGQQQQQQQQQQQSHEGDLGAMNAAPAHNYDAHRQFAPQSVYSQETGVQAPPGRGQSMRSTTQYEGSVYPPSYHTQAPPTVGQGIIGRKPVQGTWRDV